MSDFLEEQAPRVLIPKKVGLGIKEILWNQHRFDKTTGKRPFFFVKRPGFKDAFEYLRFISEITGEKREVRRWWQEFIKDHPADTSEKEKTMVKKASPRHTRARRRKRPDRGSRNPA